MTEFCDYPYCPCEGPRPTLKCGLPWRGPAEKARAERKAQQDVIDHSAAQKVLFQALPNERIDVTYDEFKALRRPSWPVDSPGEAAQQAPEYIHLVGYGRDHPDLDALRDLRAARRKRWLYRGVQAAFIGVLFAVGLFMACAVGFMTVWYLDGQAIEQAQRAAIQ